MYLFQQLESVRFKMFISHLIYYGRLVNLNVENFKIAFSVSQVFFPRTLYHVEGDDAVMKTCFEAML